MWVRKTKALRKGGYNLNVVVVMFDFEEIRNNGLDGIVDRERQYVAAEGQLRTALIALRSLNGKACFSSVLRDAQTATKKLPQLFEQLRTKPQNIEVLLDLAFHYSSLDTAAVDGELRPLFLNDRIAIYETVLTLDRRNVTAYTALGDIYAHERVDYKKAELCYLKAVALDPQKSEHYLTLAEFYVNRTQLGKAKRILEEGIRRTDNNELKHSLREISGRQAASHYQPTT